MAKITRIFLPALLCCGPVFVTAQVRVHPFEQPPHLRETSQPPATLMTFSVRPGLPQNCDPRGSVTRDGGIVTVKLNYVLADFTINNPDSKDPYGGDDPVRLRSFGGCKSGPIIDVLPGDTLRMNLFNDLDPNDPSCLATPPPGLNLDQAPGVGCFNTMNLHTHGLHVSPAGNSDNVLLSITPKTYFPYEINIPSDHPAGTFWYHAHRHGSTAVQVASGASGFLVIRGNRRYRAPTPDNPHPVADIDTILHDTRRVPFAEQFFLFQQIPYACFANDPGMPSQDWSQIHVDGGKLYSASNQTDAPWDCPKPSPNQPSSSGRVENFVLQLDSPTIWDTNGRFTSVNGVVQPKLTVPAGEIQRWRLLHAGIHDTINLQIVRATPEAKKLFATSGLSGNRQEQQADLSRLCPATAKTVLPQFEIAADGLTRAHIHELSGEGIPGAVGSNYLQPGYRSDVLVVFPDDEDYCVINQTAPDGERVVNGKGNGGQGPSHSELLAYVHVQGGRPTKTDNLEKYLTDALVAANRDLPAPVLAGLQKGDLSPWAPFTELSPPAEGNVQSAAFAIVGNPANPNGPPLFQVNGTSYDPGTVNITRQVNTTDDWTLTSTGEPHIFHIHVNPFEIIDVRQLNNVGQAVSIFDKNGNCNPSVVPPDRHGIVNQYCGLYHTFKDTIFVQNNYQVIVRTHYDRYIGEFVIHCHILDHEDGGMMLNIQLVPDINAPGGGSTMTGMRHP
jgi:FtsP/CotA-like multicopper oxidase with cupredoxin domain